MDTSLCSSILPGGSVTWVLDSLYSASVWYVVVVKPLDGLLSKTSVLLPEIAMSLCLLLKTPEGSVESWEIEIWHAETSARGGSLASVLLSFGTSSTLSSSIKPTLSRFPETLLHPSLAGSTTIWFFSLQIDSWVFESFVGDSFGSVTSIWSNPDDKPCVPASFINDNLIADSVGFSSVSTASMPSFSVSLLLWSTLSIDSLVALVSVTFSFIGISFLSFSLPVISLSSFEESKTVISELLVAASVWSPIWVLECCALFIVLTSSASFSFWPSSAPFCHFAKPRCLLFPCLVSSFLGSSSFLVIVVANSFEYLCSIGCGNITFA